LEKSAQLFYQWWMMLMISATSAMAANAIRNQSCFTGLAPQVVDLARRHFFPLVTHEALVFSTHALHRQIAVWLRSNRTNWSAGRSFMQVVQNRLLVRSGVTSCMYLRRVALFI
jgi:hypothetical protein